MSKNNISKKIYPIVRVYLNDENKAFGPGIARLLDLIEEKESIQKACKIMKMSYTKAWNIIKKCEKELGLKLVVTKVGGIDGGKTELTNDGKKVLKNYELLVKNTETFVDNYFKKNFK